MAPVVAGPREDGLFISHVHRGGGARERPDNTLETFLWCWGNGSALECDCRCTANGVGIMYHDNTLGRTTRGIPAEWNARKISEMKWEEVRDIDVGSYLDPRYATERIPTMQAGGDQEACYHKLWELGCDGFSTDYPSVMFKVIRDLKVAAK